jgi:hypothetical protein
MTNSGRDSVCNLSPLTRPRTGPISRGILSAKQGIGSMAKSGTRGIYRTQTPESGARYATVLYGDTAALDTLTEAHYRAAEYPPPFDDLPTKEQYDAREAEKNVKGPNA